MEPWLTWALQALIALLLARLWGQLDDATKAIHALNVLVTEQGIKYKLEMAEQYVKIDQWMHVRKRLHDLEDYVSGLKALAKFKEQGAGDD